MGLSLKELQKYSGKPNDRIPIFLDLIRDRKLFKLDSIEDYVTVSGIRIGENSLIPFGDLSIPEIYEQTKRSISESPPKSKLTVECCSSITYESSTLSTTRLEKTTAFGGRKEAVYAAENNSLVELNELIDRSKKETNSEWINIRLGNAIFRKISHAVKTQIPNTESRQPKSDFDLVDVYGQSRCFISHKKSPSPTEIRQWGGVSIWSSCNPHVIAFKNLLGEHGITSLAGHPEQTNYGYRLSLSDRASYDMVCMATFGKDYFTSYNKGPNNVNIIAMGHFSLKKSINCHVLSGDKIFHDPIQLCRDPVYTPILVSENSSSRNDLGLKNTRIIVYPLGGKRNVEFL